MYSIKTFCAHYGFSEAYYFLLQRRGLGPETVSIGRRKLITPEAAAAWWKTQAKAA